MHVTRVELENIKSYTSAAFDFSRGTTAITGRNGAGKTTILEAIAWALFDSLEYSKTDFVRRGAKKGIVRVTFVSSADERPYTVYRDTANGYYVIDDELKQRIAEQKKDVGDTLRLHLGLEPNMEMKQLFRSAIGVPQGLFTAAFLETAVKRKTEFDKLLKVEEYRDGAEKLLLTTNLINNRMIERRERIAGAEGKLARYESLIAERDAATRRVSELTAELNAATREADTQQALVTQLDAAERHLLEAQTVRHTLEVKRQAAERDVQHARHELEAAQHAAATQAATRERAAQHTAATEELTKLHRTARERDRTLKNLNDARHALIKLESEFEAASDKLELAELARESLLKIQPDIIRQQELERERERLVDLRAAATAATNRLKHLESQLADLRVHHKRTREVQRELEKLQHAPSLLAALEVERKGIEADLAAAEKADVACRHLTQNQKRLEAEAMRAERAVEKLESDVRALTERLAGALPLDEARHREQTAARHIASLEAEITRDERFQKEVKGGLCPILSEKCLNLPEGATLETYFADQLPTLRAKLHQARHLYTTAQDFLHHAQEADRTRARLELLDAQLLREQEAAAEAHANRARGAAEIETLTARFELPELQQRLGDIDRRLLQLRDEAMRFAQLDSTNLQLQEIETEGKRRREEHAELTAIAGGLPHLEADLMQVDAELAVLNNPRARAVALEKDAARETQFKQLCETKQLEITARREVLTGIEHELNRFTTLDDDIARETQRRDDTGEDYQKHLAAAALAATLPTRTQRFTECSDELARLRLAEQEAEQVFEVARNAYDREQHNRARGLWQVARDRCVSAEAQLAHTRAQLEVFGTEIAELDTVRRQMQKEVQDIARLQTLFDATDFIRDTLKKAGPLVTESYLAGISSEANSLYREITGDADRTLRWTRDYEITLEQESHERPFYNLSGGEQMVAALSVRLALLKQLSDIRLAIFDEPTTNMDAERRARLAEAIGQVRHFEQLLVISHDDAFEAAADHVINVEQHTAASLISS